MIQNLHDVIQLIESDWCNKRVLVVGDVMLDRYIWGQVERISPEAPVPVVHVAQHSQRPGGAANVAMNVAGLGAKAILFGFSGNDDAGNALEDSLRAAGVVPHLTRVSSHPTTTKLRILSGKQQMLRLDTEQSTGYPREACDSLIAAVEAALAEADAVVLSDYAKGCLSEEICQRVIAAARSREIPLLVDPKQLNFTRYRGATTICPNLKELSAVVGISMKEPEALLSAGQSLVPQLGLACLTATLSEKGIAVLTEESRWIAPAVARQVFDVSGAGDTVIATLALALASRLKMETGVQLANIAAGVVVGKVGTVPVTRNELLTSLTPEIELSTEEKVLTRESLQVRVSAWRSSGQSIVFTNGCFDLLHVGHISLLEEARRAGDRLIVGINSDDSVRGLKGPTRPVVHERNRGRILAALAAVDAVIVFDEPTPLRLITDLKPDVLVKGGDYSEDTIVGAAEVRSWGGRIKIVPTVEGFSTTKLIAKAATGEDQALLDVKTTAF
ncbi:MAG TPA: bifunctional D-glycero-beta-D-manno-heptose-7-phosphate kinase/D-glycero-beta-D-manno-heptose 1-phosphate adenylyltransferase HldE [Acidobacteriaceae bacterium]|nr:bifunctional D-glycero-beta-D-manno-heptose-7-phosphate kinase/D-glycero-beta-D-manno-heptose 1-phosphate adenylyltransferase HldE [Terracidiphilus sp.]HUB18344.1 bifunctional D-glycero-beta-D-manno-heptose-7-phosphate kinase/D-glycero-beta-D-manno-heptose 1-phosphate adenylyltransferase HldE [Acidobacteriaceae bacterium]